MNCQGIDMAKRKFNISKNGGKKSHKNHKILMCKKKTLEKKGKIHKKSQIKILLFHFLKKNSPKKFFLFKKK
jgi:hypothetical protein